MPDADELHRGQASRCRRARRCSTAPTVDTSARAATRAHAPSIWCESQTLMTGDVVADARVRPGDADGGPVRRRSNFNARGAKQFDDLTGAQRRQAPGDRPRQHRLLGAGDPGAHRRRPRLDHRQLRHQGSARSGDRAARRRAAGAGARRRGAHRRPVARARTRSARGFTSFVVGGSLVIVFMLIYYKFAGAARRPGADAATSSSCSAALAAFQATLTLPGIAGIVLTIGMAVDANVLINERIREELRARQDGARRHRRRLRARLAGDPRHQHHHVPRRARSCSSSAPARSGASPSRCASAWSAACSPPSSARASSTTTC